MSDTSRTLVLLRHAKSAYPPGAPDHDRPLAARGVREAGLAGEWLRAAVPAIDLALCSTATRARQTFAQSGIDAPVRFADRLYDAAPGTVIAEINAVTDEVRTLLVIGHEPTMSQLALGLAGGEGTDAALTAHISIKFPTSAIAVLRVPGRWADVELGTAALIDFHLPR